MYLLYRRHLNNGTTLWNLYRDLMYTIYSAFFIMATRNYSWSVSISVSIFVVFNQPLDPASGRRDAGVCLHELGEPGGGPQPRHDRGEPAARGGGGGGGGGEPDWHPPRHLPPPPTGGGGRAGAWPGRPQDWWDNFFNNCHLSWLGSVVRNLDAVF